MLRFYDKLGNPLTLLEWDTFLRERTDPDYKRVAQTTLPDGKWISTVWLGYNHQWGEGPPLIFETMVFTSCDYLEDLDIDRYTTLADAEAGHIIMVAKWLK